MFQILGVWLQVVYFRRIYTQPNLVKIILVMVKSIPCAQQGFHEP